jgi:DNA-binding CsgD family transcriptional regulator
MTSEILGRDEELGLLDAFLDGTDRGVRALVLEGEAGVGKSTLWAAGLASAEQRGFQVLSSRPAEAERGLPHVVLADLLEGVVEEVLPTLSAPRRRALEGALLMDRAPEYGVDPRALAVAVRASFQVLAEEQALVLAVDDTQWVDSSSASALAFALRRLRSEQILLLLARRLDERREGPAVEEALEPDTVERLRVGPLSMGAIHTLLQLRLDRQFARPTLRRLHEISGGNPFYALELARGLDSPGATVDSVEPFPVPETLERLVGARLAELRGATHEGLLLIAAHGRPSLALLGAAGISPNALEPAFAAQVVELSTDAVRFTHPLLASVLYQESAEEERRETHGRLAAVVDDPVERARHLALASDGPDQEVAAMLEEAAKLPPSRGAGVAAAELAEHALRLTPSEAAEDRDRRTIAAARAHFDAGDARRARALALELHARPSGRSAEALVLLSDIEGEGGRLERSIELRREALEAANTQPKLLVEIHQWLGSFTRFTEGAAAGDRHAAAALELAEAIGDDSLRAGALCALAFGRFRAGLPGALSQVEQAVQLATSVGDPRQRLEINFLAVNCFVWAYQLDRARTLLQSIDSEWSERDELAKSYVFWWLAMIELRSGRFPIAADYAERAREIQRQYKIGDHKEPDVWQVALIAAHRGELDLARSLTESNRPVTEAYAIGRSGDDGVLGLVELGSGRPAAAAAHFAAAEADRQGIGVNEPAMFWWRADYAEALIGSGRLDEAASLVEAREAEAKRLDRAAVLADMKRCRGLLAAARGDLDEALAELEYAVAQHEAVGDPFGRARALLALGTVRRRTRQKRSAREAITAALEGFESAGAAGWAEKARAELGTIGGRTRFDGLTPAEGRIAALVAEGRTNREVAAALFLTEHTVATALTRVYRKLGVRSRTELARLAQTQDADLAKT